MIQSVSYRFRNAKLGGRQNFDFILWLIASRLAAYDLRHGAPTPKQHGLMRKALYKWMAASSDQLLSQLLLQLLLLAYGIPPSSELEEGAPEACTFVANTVAAVSDASKLTPGKLTFAEVQLSFVLTSASFLFPWWRGQFFSGACSIHLS
jgi:hypothetical protein